jgi:hypothetical protein
LTAWSGGAPHAPFWKSEIDPAQLLPIGTPHVQGEQLGTGLS